METKRTGWVLFLWKLHPDGAVQMEEFYFLTSGHMSALDVLKQNTLAADECVDIYSFFEDRSELRQTHHGFLGLQFSLRGPTKDQRNTYVTNFIREVCGSLSNSIVIHAETEKC